MDPIQAIRTTPSRVNDVDPMGSDSGTETIPSGPTGTSGATGTTQAQRIPPIGTSSKDRSPAIDQTSIPERVRARVWNRPGDWQSAEDPTRSQSKPILPTPLAQTRGELTEIRGMVSTLIDEIRSQTIVNQTIANRLEQAEKELADHRAANSRERNQTSLDPLWSTSNPQNAGLFGTPEIPSARSGRYTGENSQLPPLLGMTHRSLSYCGLYEIDTGLQRPRSTPIQFQNRSTERHGEPRTRIPPPNPLIPDNLTEQARRHDLHGHVNIDPQREDLGIPSETRAFQNYIERNDAELKRIHAIVHMATSSAPDIDCGNQNSHCRFPFKLEKLGKP
ncbi:hypothetical protein F2Q70_00012472 [Brassica cretica]|uniref:Uncharacterized protein n=1 Tax=Brassica cretica TaxID=69181 RepID=A0A8S9M8E3_BRACR|nr:hypothetical protein F2Q70_00012472 [Brassica cretica]